MNNTFTVEAFLKATGVTEFQKAFANAEKAIDNFDNASKKIGEVGDSIKDFGGNMTKYITTPIVGAISASVWQFADLEQAVGGIETLFKDSADAVIKNSESAYKRAGVSGVDYMENVTSFSASLLSGLGGDTEKATKIADLAMVDMSDNANKMGTNIQDIQNAYQGFAKENFTMLDNLKLGFGGTKEGMEDLLKQAGKLSGRKFSIDSFSDIIEAIHVIQDEMDITGTTVLEAEETVSGAFGMMKASLQDLAGGFGQEGANIEQLIQNLLDSVQVFAENIIRVIKTMWDNLPIPDWGKWLIGLAIVAGPMIMVLGTIISVIGKVMGIVKVLSGVIAFLASPVTLVVVAIAAFVAALVYLYNTNETVRDVINRVWDAILSTVMSVVEIVSTYIKSVFGGILSWWKDNQEMILEAARNAWTFIKSVIETTMNIIKSIMEVVWPIIQKVIEFAWDGIKNIIDGTIKVITGIIEFFAALFTGNWTALWESVKNIVSGAVQAVWGFIQLWLVGKVIAIAKAFIGGLVGFFKTGWAAIRGFFSGGTAFIKNVITNAFVAVKSAISGGMTTAWNVIKSFFGKFTSAGGNIVSNIAKGITGAIGKVTGAIKGVLSKARNLLPFSPPKDKSSPMAGIENNGITEQIAKGIYGGENLIDRALKDVLSTPDIDINGSIMRSNAQIGSTINHEINVGSTVRPAEISLNLGGTVYKTFVEDISQQQNKDLQLEIGYYGGN